ncbi:MAG TPA: putative molybdenum carrier protein [Planctomycetaceae bacterium]|nr:putative molybdenum carrier protein [Planctomycetaceae bacterium]
MTAAKRTRAARRKPQVLLEQIISGGQTGVDRAALDVALELGIPCGGWCPRGRKAEDGPIPDRYPLAETPTARYAERTERNVSESDGTLILTNGPIAGGTALTKACAERLGRPLHVVDFSANGDEVAGLIRWLADNSIGTLNVAGPRESQQPGVYVLARDFLRQLLAAANRPTIAGCNSD